ncbi:MAG: hypothetical protein HY067_18900 [Betaproteobacteria bacterium]|nr:hypothetical protein [Betaproteobacteria bacterium]
MIPARLSALVFSVFLLAACATASHVITGKTRTPIDPSQVKVYSTAPPGYEEIAVVDATSRLSFSFGDQKKMDAVMERLRKEAASLGANGVLLQSTGTESGGGISTGIGTGVGIGGGLSVGTGIFTASDNKTGRGLAIHVPTPPQQ